MRKTIYICDRCGKENNENNLQYLSASLCTSEELQSIPVSEFCPECAEKMKELFAQMVGNITVNHITADTAVKDTAETAEKEDPEAPIKADCIATFNELAHRNSPSSLAKLEKEEAEKFAMTREVIRSRFKDSAPVSLGRFCDICFKTFGYHKKTIAEAAGIRPEDLSRQKPFPATQQKLAQYYGVKIIE